MAIRLDYVKYRKKPIIYLLGDMMRYDKAH